MEHLLISIAEKGDKTGKLLKIEAAKVVTCTRGIFIYESETTPMEDASSFYSHDGYEIEITAA